MPSTLEIQILKIVPALQKSKVQCWGQARKLAINVQKVKCHTGAMPVSIVQRKAC